MLIRVQAHLVLWWVASPASSYHSTLHSSPSQLESNVSGWGLLFGVRVLCTRLSLRADLFSDFRSALIEAGTRGQPTSSQECTCSVLAGSLSGALNGAFRESMEQTIDKLSNPP